MDSIDFIPLVMMALVVVVGVVVVVTTTVSTLISNLGLPVLWLSFVDLGP